MYLCTNSTWCEWLDTAVKKWLNASTFISGTSCLLRRWLTTWPNFASPWRRPLWLLHVWSLQQSHAEEVSFLEGTIVSGTRRCCMGYGDRQQQHQMNQVSWTVWLVEQPCQKELSWSEACYRCGKSSHSHPVAVLLERLVTIARIRATSQQCVNPRNIACLLVSRRLQWWLITLRKRAPHLPRNCACSSLVRTHPRPNPCAVRCSLINSLWPWSRHRGCSLPHVWAHVQALFL